MLFRSVSPRPRKPTQLRGLFVGRLQPVSVGCLDGAHTQSIPENTFAIKRLWCPNELKSLNPLKPFYPSAQAAGLYGLMCKVASGGSGTRAQIRRSRVMVWQQLAPSISVATSPWSRSRQ